MYKSKEDIDLLLTIQVWV